MSYVFRFVHDPVDFLQQLGGLRRFAIIFVPHIPPPAVFLPDMGDCQTY
jgi:hypothetical protein